MHKENFRKSAIANIVRSIDRGKTFPRQVFLGDWCCFRILLADFIFHERFIFLVRSLLVAESSNVVALVKIPLDTAMDISEDSVYVDINTGVDEYYDGLKNNGWLYEFLEFAAASDKGDWCIYLERCAEVAVIAFKDEGLVDKFEAAMKDELFIQPLALSGDINELGFPYSEFNDFWIESFVKNYG